MSYTLNKVTIIGRVGTIKEGTYNGNFRLQFSIATDRPAYLKDGVKQNPIEDWHYVTVWRERATMCKNRLKPGDLVCVTGELRYNKDKKDPNKLWTEIYIPDNEKIGFFGRSGNLRFTQEISEQEIPEQESMPLINGVKPYASSVNKPNNPFKKKEDISTLNLDDDIPF